VARWEPAVEVAETPKTLGSYAKLTWVVPEGSVLFLSWGLGGGATQRVVHWRYAVWSFCRAGSGVCFLLPSE